MNLVLNDIITLCKQNNRKAQLQLYKQYCQGMFSIAKRYLKNSTDAEDVVQEAFIKAFQRLEQFQGEVTFGAWLKRIVINKCLDVLKQKKHFFEDIDEKQIPHESTVLTLDIIEDDTTTQEIKRAMETLPEKYQCVLSLYLIDGYDHEEISTVLQITQVSSRTLLSRGKTKLKAVLKNKNYGERY